MDNAERDRKIAKSKRSDKIFAYAVTAATVLATGIYVYMQYRKDEKAWEAFDQRMRNRCLELKTEASDLAQRNGDETMQMLLKDYEWCLDKRSYRSIDRDTSMLWHYVDKYSPK